MCGPCSRPIPPHHRLLAAQRGPTHRRDDVVGKIVWNLHYGKRLGDADSAYGAGRHAALTRNRADQIRWPDLVLLPRTDEEPRETAFGWTLVSSRSGRAFRRR